MLGRRKMRKGVAGFIERERELAEPNAPAEAVAAHGARAAAVV